MKRGNIDRESAWFAYFGLKRRHKPDNSNILLYETERGADSLENEPMTNSEIGGVKSTDLEN
jgi:hypothetical protein